MNYRTQEKEKMTKKSAIIKIIIYCCLVALLIYRLVISFSYKSELTNGESNNTEKEFVPMNKDTFHSLIRVFKNKKYRLILDALHSVSKD